MHIQLFITTENLHRLLYEQAKTRKQMSVHIKALSHTHTHKSQRMNIDT